jgi:transposase
MQALRRREPDTPLEVRAFDEHRLGLKPVLRRIRAPRGRRPVARGHRRFQWLYVHGFVRPATGEVVRFLAPTVDAVMPSRILAAFARGIGAGSGKRIVLVLAGAGWHVAGELEIPEGIVLEFLPGHSPELQPAEHLWPIVDESVANRYFEGIQDLDQAVGEYCCTLVDDRDRIRANTLFHRWPAFA